MKLRHVYRRGPVRQKNKTKKKEIASFVFFQCKHQRLVFQQLLEVGGSVDTKFEQYVKISVPEVRAVRPAPKVNFYVDGQDLYEKTLQ